MEWMNVATALNKKYLLYTGVMLYSLCKNNETPIRAFLLHSELEEADFICLRKSLEDFQIEIISLQVDSQLFNERLPRNEMWSIETYYRLLLPELLPIEVKRLFYIDVDIIVNQSLEEVYAIEFEGTEIIATEDVSTEESMLDKQKEMFASMFSFGYKYFNAGFMLLNIEEIRKKYDFNTYLQVIEEWNYEMAAPDQDILNYVHWEKVGYIDYRKYDMFARIAHNRGMTYEQVKNEVTVIHYAGTKPWNADNCHFDIEQLWWDYAKQTPFYLQLLEEFLHKTMFDTTLETYVGGILEQNTELQQNLKDLGFWHRRSSEF